MPGTTIVDDIELIIEDIGGGGGGKAPPAGGDDGGDSDKRRRPNVPPSRRYATAILLSMVSIVMFFMAMVSAFLFLRATSNRWVPLHLPSILWLNTVILLSSSVLIEMARRRLALGEVRRFNNLWKTATLFGVLFLAGQLVAWRQFVDAGFDVGTTQASSFFYILTGLHGLHLLGGICALLYVSFRKFEKAKISRAAAAEVVSYFWHFLDGLWIFLLALLYFGR
ncbi:MAG: cytochrome c oxidase subunit 3 [Candidatus Acidiferrum sp.]